MEDEDALHWAGEERAARPAERGRTRKPRPARRERAGGEAAGQRSSVELVGLGVLGGIAFLSTLGWLNYAFRGASRLGDLSGAMFNVGLWLAVFAPGLWFVTVLSLVHRTGLRYTLLTLGALVLLPIPLVWPQ